MIWELVGFQSGLTEEDCSLLDSIYGQFEVPFGIGAAQFTT